MRFTVPQFIEHEPPIVGPLTFRQFAYVGTAGGIIFVLYFSLGKSNFTLFILAGIILLGLGAALAFLKIGGRGLPTIIVNSFRFSISPKMFIWKKTDKPVAVFKKEIKKEATAGAAPRITQESRLNKLGSQIEAKK